MKLIVAVCEGWGIGKDGTQPFFIPEDLKYFKDKTLGKVVVVGRVTFLALPGAAPLKGRTNIVLTRNKSFDAGGAAICTSSEELLQHLSNYSSDDIFVIGGRQIYDLLLPYCDTAYVTKIFAKAETDCFFPNIDEMSNWQLHDKSDIKNHDGINFCFYEYRNTSTQPRFT
ncbi:MAG: dihydrofolate reductase [Defluviitaleaceae bacterium]|nr:dihydrofolate reductase [Defluviitaleaceae bacterium]